MKDPAILFYTSDFLSATILMSDEQVGKYIKLLCIQHQKGELSEKDMLKICGTYDEDIFCKFKKAESGNYYNERMRIEVERRKKYSESRRKNRTKSYDKDMKNISKTYDKHMETETETETENKTRDKIKYSDFVKMKKSEHEKLVDQYGTKATKWMIEKLDNYKGAKGKTYKSDYRAILSWVVEEWYKHQPDRFKDFQL